MIAAIDIGGTSIKFGVVDPTTDNFEYLGKIDTNTHLNDFKMEKRLDKVLDKILKNHSISGIAISTAGIVDAKKGSLIAISNA